LQLQHNGFGFPARWRPRAEKKHNRTGNRVDDRLRSRVAVAFQFQIEKKDTVDDTAGKIFKNDRKKTCRDGGLSALAFRPGL